MLPLTLARLRLQAFPPTGHRLLENCRQRFGNVPVGIMAAALGQVRDIANVVPLARLLDVFPAHLPPRNGLDHRKRLEDRAGIAPPAAQVVHLSAPWRSHKYLDEPRHIMRVNVVPHLFALVAENPVRAAGQVHLHQVAQEAVQLDPRVVRAGQAAAAQAAGLQAEVPAVLLHHDVCCHLRGAEEGVLGLVNALGLADAVEILRPCVIPPLFQLPQRQFVGRVAIDLVGGQVHKHRLRRKPPRGFQEVHRAPRVHVEVIKGPLGGQIMRGLSGGVHHQVRSQGLQTFQHPGAVADVQGVVVKPPAGGLQPPAVPLGVARRAEEVRAQVVVHTVDLPPQGVEMRHHFRTDQPTGAGDQEFVHSKPIRLAVR